MLISNLLTAAQVLPSVEMVVFSDLPLAFVASRRKIGGMPDSHAKSGNSNGCYAVDAVNTLKPPD